MVFNCSVFINDRKGVEVKDWRAGKLVRVVRNVKGRKYSKYVFIEGNRYDGIYKVSGRFARVAFFVFNIFDGVFVFCRW